MADRSVVVRLRAEVAGFKSAMNEAAESAKKVGTGADESAKKADTAMGRMVQSATQNREAWNTAGTALTAFGAATTAAIGATINEAIKWESAWTGVLKTVDGTPEQLSKVEDGLRGLAKELPSSHAEIAAVAEAAGQLGIQTDSVVDFTKVMIDLGQATNLSAEEAATSLARFSNIMGTSQQDVGKLGATLVGLGNSFATTESEIMAMSMRLAGAGKQAGLSEGQVMGLAAAMSSVGIEAEAGGTAMSQTMKRIGRAVDEGGQQLDKFAKVAGMSSSDFKKAWQDDAGTAIVTFIQGLDNAAASGESVNAILRDLGISGIRESDALLRLSANSEGAFAAMTQGVEEYVNGTALLEEANKRYETTEAKIAMAKNAIADAAITFGATFLPVVAGVAEGVSDLTTKFASLPGPVQAAVGIIGGLAGSASLAAGSFLLLAPRAIETWDALGKMGKVGASAQGAIRGLGTAAQAAAGPIGIAVAAIIAIVAALDNLTKTSTTTFTGDQYLSGLLDIRDAASGSTEALDEFFTLAQGGVGGFNVTEEITGLDDALTLLFQGDWSAKGRDLFSWLPLIDNADLRQAREGIEGIDAALAAMVSSGQAADASAVWDTLVERAGALGISVEELAEKFPTYADSLRGVENQQRLLTDSSGDLGDAVDVLGGAMDEAESSAIDMEAAQKALEEALEESRKAAEDAAKSFLDIADGASESLDTWIAKQRENTAALVAWGDNMEKIRDAGASKELLDQVIQLGQDGAPLVQQLADAVDNNRASFDEASAAATESAMAVGTYTDTLGGVPEDVDTALNLLADTTSADDTIATWQATMMSTVTPTQVSLDDALARGTFGDLELLMSGTTTVTNVDLNDAPAQGVFMTATGLWAATTTTTHADLNDAPARGVFDQATVEWGSTTTTTHLDANDDPARGSVNAFTGWANGQTATVKAQADTATAEYQISLLTRARTVAINFIPGAMPAARATGGPIEGFAGGGAIRGPGTGTSDSIPAIGPSGRLLRVSNGEHVVTDAEVRAAGGHDVIYELRRAMLAGAFRRYATGGEVTPRYMPGVVSRTAALSGGPGIDYDRLGASVARAIDPSMLTFARAVIRSIRLGADLAVSDSVLSRTGGWSS